MKILKLFTLVLIGLSFIVSAYMYPNMPATVVSHWGLYGEANGYSSKSFGLFFTPILSLGLVLLFQLLPKIDPLKHNIASFRKYYDLFIFLVVGFLFYLHLLILFWNLGYDFSFIQYLIPAFSVLFYFIGEVMAKSKRNWLIGIRTPWTLSNNVVWDKTHKKAASLYKVDAAVILTGIIFPFWAFYIMIIPIVLVSIYLVIYSYLMFRKL